MSLHTIVSALTTASVLAVTVLVPNGAAATTAMFPFRVFNLEEQEVQAIESLILGAYEEEARVTVIAPEESERVLETPAHHGFRGVDVHDRGGDALREVGEAREPRRESRRGLLAALGPEGLAVAVACGRRLLLSEEVERSRGGPAPIDADVERSGREHEPQHAGAQQRNSCDSTPVHDYPSIPSDSLPGSTSRAGSRGPRSGRESYTAAQHICQPSGIITGYRPPPR